MVLCVSFFLLTACSSNKQASYDGDIKKAIAFFKESQYEKAEKKFEAASDIKIANNKAGIYGKQVKHYRKAVDYAMSEDVNQAKKELEKARSDDGLKEINDAAIELTIEVDQLLSKKFELQTLYEETIILIAENKLEEANHVLEKFKETQYSGPLYQQLVDSAASVEKELLAQGQLTTPVESNLFEDVFSKKPDKFTINFNYNSIDATNQDRGVKDIGVDVIIENLSDTNVSVTNTLFSLKEMRDLPILKPVETTVTIKAGESRVIKQVLIGDVSVFVNNDLCYQGLEIGKLMAIDDGYYFDGQWVN